MYPALPPAEAVAKQTSGNTRAFLYKTESLFSTNDTVPLQRERILF